MLLVTAIDAAGNADPTPERRDFTVFVPLPPAATPTPVATATPKPKPPALTGVTIAKTVSLKALRKTKKLRFTVRTASGARVAVEAKLGTKSLGKATRTATGAVTIKLDAKRLKAARRGATITLRIQASGTNLTPVTRTAKLKLKT